MDEKKGNDQYNDLSQIEETDPLMFYIRSSSTGHVVFFVSLGSVGKLDRR